MTQQQNNTTIETGSWIEKKVLLVGDNRAREYGNMESVDVHPSITLLFKEGANLQTIVEIINENLEPTYDILIIFGILHDLAELSENSDGKPLLKPKKCDINAIVEDIELYTRIWKMLFPNLCIIWTYPSIPDFDRFNGPKNHLTILETQLFSITYVKLKNLWTSYMTGFPLYELNQTTFPQRAFKHYYSDFVKSGTFPKFKEDLSGDGIHPSTTATVKFWNKLKNFYNLCMNLYNSAYGSSDSKNDFSCPECPDIKYEELMKTHIFVSERPKIHEFNMGVPVVLDKNVSVSDDGTVTEEILQENCIEITHPVAMKT